MMKEWTDIDYAQAAIDMLPGSVEEIEEFLRKQELGITTRCNGNRCPVARWVTKWTGHTVYAGICNVYMGERVGVGRMVPYPHPVTEFVIAFDDGEISL